MNQKQLKKAITEGIDGSFPSLVLKGVILAIIVSEVIIIGALIYGYYQTQKWEREHCGESGCPLDIIQPIDNCVLGRLDCIVVDESMIKYEGESGGGALPVIQQYHGLCGFAEANAWFEQYKQQINGGDELYLKCS